ncbi:MAG: hypothetical protein ACP5FL_03740 [Thermoplasmatota archaeon]
MEGPSIHRIADRLHIFAGQTIEHAAGNAHQPKELLQGARIASVRAVKKRLFMETGVATAVIHFLMYGSYRVNKQRDLDERLSLYCSRDDLHFYSCSVKILHSGSEELAGYDDPEGDVLSDQFDYKRALQAMHTDDRIIADVLLDQDIFGGIGNILKNEVLFTTQVHPASPASAIDREKATAIIDAAVELAGAWYRDKRADRQREWTIYRQAICPTCGAQVTRKKMGSFDRITFFCRDCQHRYSG